MSDIPFRFKNRTSQVSGFIPDATGICDGEFFIQQADKAILFKDVYGSLVEIKNVQTGSFITTSQTGNFGGGNIDLSSYVTTGQTGVFALSAGTGSFVTAVQTGTLVGTDQTGNFLVNQTSASGNIINSIFSNISGACRSIIIGGSGNCISGSVIFNSAILVGSGIIANSSNTVHANNFCAYGGKFYGDGCSLTLKRSVVINNGDSSSQYSLAIGGLSNTIGGTSTYSNIIGGTLNAVDGNWATVVGGSSNKHTAGTYGGIFVGYGNCVISSCSVIVGGYLNCICNASISSVIAGGQQNIFGCFNGFTPYSVILAGCNNSIYSGSYSAIFAGRNNSMINGLTGVIILGGNGIVASSHNTVYAVNYCATGGKFFGDGSSLTGLATGLFITTGQTGAFGGADLSNYVTTSQFSSGLNFNNNYTSVVLGQNTSNCIVDGANNSTIITSRNSCITGASTNAIIIGSNYSCSVSSMDNGIIIGGRCNILCNLMSCDTIIIGGHSNCFCGTDFQSSRSVILGGSGIQANSNDTVFANNFCAYNGKFYGNGSSLTGLATGSFITTGMTGNFGGAVDLSAYVTTGQTGVFALSAGTGSFVTTAQTGVFALSAGTGSFVTTAQTGVFLSNSGNKTLVGSFTAASGFIACNGRYYNDQYYGYVIVGDGTNSITSSSPGNSIFGGTNNGIGSTQTHSTIVGGRYNAISSAGSNHSAILGGCYNSISNSALASVVAGGGDNYICCTFGFIGGGCSNHLRACNSVILGSCRITGTASFTTYVTNLCSIGGYVSIGAIQESIITCASGASGLINFNVCNSPSMYYIQNSTADFYLNLRSNNSTTLNSILEINKTLTVTFLNTNGLTAYPLTGIAIDGTGRSIKWLNGTGSYPAANASGIDSYSITAIKTGDNLYTVLGSQGKFV